jgi:hypothetical protein
MKDINIVFVISATLLILGGMRGYSAYKLLETEVTEANASQRACEQSIKNISEDYEAKLADERDKAKLAADMLSKERIDNENSSASLIVKNSIRKECQDTLDKNTSDMVALANESPDPASFLADAAKKGIISDGTSKWMDECIAQKENLLN